ncbi:hypothetical protein LZ32DRAFT_202823 [Colletotrichum eremochloae]|nr:hypothetical protein LZ32DRAFT_202823 [Colletotrichum eremochloae]
MDPIKFSVSGPFPSDSLSPPQISKSYREAILPDRVQAASSSSTTSRAVQLPLKMAKKAKSRVMIVRLLSMAATGYFYTFKRLRTASPMSMLKYDPIVRRKVLFLEQKKKGK